jgi:hypothetical protein
MSAKVKAIIVAVLALLGSAFSYYVAYSDGDDSTKPDSAVVINDAKAVYDASTAKTESEIVAPETTVTE